jgi:Tol biopolymer transport system component
VPRSGGRPGRFHSWASEQVHSGISVSSDYRWAAIIGPADDGTFQLFRVPLAGGVAEQLTFDGTDKTHPAYSPAGERLAFTTFSYRALFFLIEP